jgi:ABC-type xylose transport system permease subunit
MNDNTNPKGLFKVLAERSKAETPPFFKKLRIVGLALAAAGGILVATPIALPAIVTTIAGYLIVAGSVATAVSQVAVQDEEEGS